MEDKKQAFWEKVSRMDVKTGYFARAKEYQDAGYVVFGISRFPPKWLDIQNIPALAPDAELLRDYKMGRADDMEYDMRYMANLTAHKGQVAYILNAIASRGITKCVFCCYEKPGSFCHRHLFAKFLKDAFGLTVEEFPVKRKERPEHDTEMEL